MKRIFLVLTVLMILSSIEVFSQTPCPPGYDDSGIVTIPYSTTCTLTVYFCVSNQPPQGMNHRSIHITDFEWSSDDCIQGWAQDANGDYIPEFPDYNDLIAQIMLEHPEYFPTTEFNLCDGDTHQNGTILEVTDGGCYRTTNGFPEGYKVIPCDIYNIAKCHQYHTVCYRFIEGEYELIVVSGPATPLFGCPLVPPPSCYSRCNTN